jgi:predicted MFS family arabinose efflux permease
MPRLLALSETVPANRQGTAIAVFTSSFTVGSSLSFALSGLLASAFGWRLEFALLALGPLAAVAIGFAVLPPTRFAESRLTAGRRSGPCCKTAGRFTLLRPMGYTIPRFR